MEELYVDPKEMLIKVLLFSRLILVSCLMTNTLRYSKVSRYFYNIKWEGTGTEARDVENPWLHAPCIATLNNDQKMPIWITLRPDRHLYSKRSKLRVGLKTKCCKSGREAHLSGTLPQLLDKKTRCKEKSPEQEMESIWIYSNIIATQ